MLPGLNIDKNAATPIEHATDDYLTCLDGVYPYADYVTVTSPAPKHKACAAWNATLRWTPCWAR